ncbi:Choline transport protein [Ilyonectria robusta]
MAWAFSRDRGFPFHTYLSQIAPEPFGTPIWAHVWSCAWTAVLGCFYLGSTLAFNSLVAGGILLQYLTYSASIGCLLWHGRANFQHGPFWFPRAGYVANITTIIWTVISLVMYSFPSFLPVEADQMNYVSCVIVGVLLFAVGYWLLYGRKEFETPQPQDYERVSSKLECRDVVCMKMVQLATMAYACRALHHPKAHPVPEFSVTAVTVDDDGSTQWRHALPRSRT